VLIDARGADDPPGGARTNDPQLAVSLNNLGMLLQEKRDLQQAEAMFQEALAIDRRRLCSEHPEVAIKLVNLARIFSDQGRFESAERGLPSTPPMEIRAAAERLVAFYAASGRPADAATWKNRVQGVAKVSR
jgi:tetratricopeptide (TPR) repeat protein